MCGSKPIKIDLYWFGYRFHIIKNQSPETQTKPLYFIIIYFISYYIRSIILKNILYSCIFHRLYILFLILAYVLVLIA